MTDLHVLRVFLGPDGRHGNPLGIFLDGPAVPGSLRQAVAAHLNFSETVFVDGVEDGAARMRILTPTVELPFAGHPSVGTSWLLRELGRPVDVLRIPAGDLATWHDEQRTWIRARPEWVHWIEFEEMRTAADVDGLTGAPPGARSWYAWAWIDERRGELRARYFVEEYGIVEDQATGSAAVMMGARLGRPLTIRQGRGSELLVRPTPDGWVEVGGRVALDEIREYVPEAR